jgi:Xaa-Pro aminopeptidase
MKAQKNAVSLKSRSESFRELMIQSEMEGFRQCHIRDGAALVRYFAWLEEVLQKGEHWTEYDAGEELEKFRK